MPPGSDDHSSTSSSSSTTSEERFISKSRKGWAGGDLELEHQRESWGKEKVSAAVDISQFQNHEVGKGYQAKHVVRQQSAAKPTVEVKDMTRSGKRAEPDNKEKSHKSEARREKRKHRDNSEEKDNPRRRLQKYLACPAFISFRKEIEDILSS